SIHTLIKNGLSWATLLGVLVLLLKNKKIKNHIKRHLPVMFRDPEDERLEIIIRQQNEILRRLGGESWESARQFVDSNPSLVQHKKQFFTSCLTGFITARSAKSYTNYQTNGRVKIMKWLKPEFLTFVVGAVVVVLNEKF